MIRNYLTVAMRHLLRNKTYVVINTAGMGIAIACCMASYLLLAYNIEFDSYFKKEDVSDIVKVMHHYRTSTGEIDQSLVCPIVMAPRAVQEIAGIKASTRFCNEDGIVGYGEQAFRENIRFADASFFELFHIGLTSGTHKSFQDKQSAYISSAMAKKYFDNKNPVGETITVEINGTKQEVIIGGVLEPLPLNISFHIDLLLRMEIYLDAHQIDPDQWDSDHSASVLFKISDVNQHQTIGRQLNRYMTLINQDRKEATTTSFELIPFTTPVINGEVDGSDLRLPIPTIALVIFSTLGGMILLIACFNLTNTTLALTGRRLREIGVRKVVGSGRTQIAAQFLVEMTLTVALAVGAGVIIAQFIVPQFALMWQLQYGLHDLNMLNLIIALSVLLFATALLAGVYPALFNSRYNPVELLKGKKTLQGTSFFHRLLMVVQFSLSVVVLIAGVVFTQNVTYQKELNMGYDKEKLLTIAVQGEEYSRLKNSIYEKVAIEQIAGADNHIGPYTSGRVPVKIDTTVFKTPLFKVGINYFHTIGLPLVAGRDFMETNLSDYELSVIVDENFVKNHQLNNPLGTTLRINDKPYQITGIVKNHLSGLKQRNNSEHIYTLTATDNYSTMIVRADAHNLPAVRATVEKEWKKLFPGKPFESKLQEEIVYEEANEYNTNLRQIFFFITLLGCVLSASGIYAMASLNTQKRTKEIGVRKVLGASVGNIIKLLSREFAILLTMAASIGGASGYLLTNALMDSLYQQHITIGILTLLASGLLIFTIGLLATSGTTFKMAATNPAHTLRSE